MNPRMKPVTKVVASAGQVTFTVPMSTGAPHGIMVILTKEAAYKASGENSILCERIKSSNPGQPYNLELIRMERNEKLPLLVGVHYLHFVTLGSGNTSENSDVLTRKVTISAQLANRFELNLLNNKFSKLCTDLKTFKDSVGKVPTLEEIGKAAGVKFGNELDRIKTELTQAAIAGCEDSNKLIRESLKKLEEQIQGLANKPAPTIDNTNVDQVKEDLLKLEQRLNDLANKPAPQPAATATTTAPGATAPATAATTTATPPAAPATTVPPATPVVPAPAVDYSRETTIIKWILGFILLLVLAGLSAWFYYWAHPHTTNNPGNMVNASAMKPGSTSEASVGTTTNGYGGAISQNGSATNFGNSNSFSNCSNNQVQIIGVQNNAFQIPETRITYTNIVIEAPRQEVPPPAATPDQTEYRQDNNARYLGKVSAVYQQQATETRVVSMVSQPYVVFDIGGGQQRQQRVICKQVVCNTRPARCDNVPVCFNNPPSGWSTTRTGNVIDNSPGQNQGYVGNMGFQAQDNQRVAQTPSRRVSSQGIKLASSGRRR